jgi:hypothetical protein
MLSKLILIPLYFRCKIIKIKSLFQTYETIKIIKSPIALTILLCLLIETGPNKKYPLKPTKKPTTGIPLVFQHQIYKQTLFQRLQLICSILIRWINTQCFSKIIFCFNFIGDCIYHTQIIIRFY